MTQRTSAPLRANGITTVKETRTPCLATSHLSPPRNLSSPQQARQPSRLIAHQYQGYSTHMIRERCWKKNSQCWVQKRRRKVLRGCTTGGDCCTRVRMCPVRASCRDGIDWRGPHVRGSLPYDLLPMSPFLNAQIPPMISMSPHRLVGVPSLLVSSPIDSLICYSLFSLLCCPSQCTITHWQSMPPLSRARPVPFAPCYPFSVSRIVYS